MKNTFPNRTRQFFTSKMEGDRLERKKRVSAKTIEAVRDECKKYGLQLFFVVFNGPYAGGGKDDWKDPFLRHKLEEEGIDYIDSKSIYEGLCQKDGLPLSEVHIIHGHPDAAENQVIANGIRENLKRLLKEDLFTDD